MPFLHWGVHSVVDERLRGIVQPGGEGAQGPPSRRFFRQTYKDLPSTNDLRSTRSNCQANFGRRNPRGDSHQEIVVHGIGDYKEDNTTTAPKADVRRPLPLQSWFNLLRSHGIVGIRSWLLACRLVVEPKLMAKSQGLHP